MSPVPGCSSPSDLWSWLECHPALAGYLQLVGVILALVGSYFITWVSVTRPNRLDRRDRAKVLVYRSLPIVGDMSDTLKRIRPTLTQTDYGVKLAQAGHTDFAIRALTVDADIPDTIMSAVHLFRNDLSKALAQLSFLRSRYNTFVNKNTQFAGMWGDNELAEYRTELQIRFNEFEQQAQIALALLEEAEQ
jgi:hypothetical protein